MGLWEGALYGGGPAAVAGAAGPLRERKSGRSKWPDTWNFRDGVTGGWVGGGATHFPPAGFFAHPALYLFYRYKCNPGDVGRGEGRCIREVPVGGFRDATYFDVCFSLHVVFYRNRCNPGDGGRRGGPFMGEGR